MRQAAPRRDGRLAQHGAVQQVGVVGVGVRDVERHRVAAGVRLAEALEVAPLRRLEVLVGDGQELLLLFR